MLKRGAVLALSLLCIWTAATAAVRAQSDSGEIDIVVVDATTKHPLELARVLLDGPVITSEITETNGKVTFTDVPGALAGFRMPDYEQGISVAGYHSHFVDAQRRHGGHALDYRLTRGRVEISVRSDLHLSLPRTPEFLAAELNRADVDTQIRRTEGG